MIRTQIQLTSGQMEKIKKLSKTQHISSAEFVRRAIERFTAEDMEEPQDKRLERAKAAAGKFASGSSDGSRRHDDYFAATAVS